jgi:hypothetical protein
MVHDFPIYGIITSSIEASLSLQTQQTYKNIKFNFQNGFFIT